MNAATLSKLEEIRERLEGRLQEAEEVTEKDLTPTLKKQRQAVGKLLRAKPAAIWSGVHGHVFEYDASAGGTRLSQKTLASLAKVKGLRWFESTDEYSVSVGMGYK